MALVSKDAVTRVDIPHEPGEWVEIRALTAGDFRSFELAGDGTIDLGSVTLQGMAKAVSAWSYSEAPSLETMESLDMQTTLWLMNEINGLSGLRSPVEKKVLAAASPPGPQPATANGRRNSRT